MAEYVSRPPKGGATGGGVGGGVKVDEEMVNRIVRSEMASYDTQMATMSFPKYGAISLPSDFRHNLDFQLWRDVDGKIKHNFDFNNRVKDYKTFYVSESGANGNDGLTRTTPKSTMTQIIDLVESDSTITHAKIVIVDNILSKDRILSKRELSKSYAIVPELDNKPCYIGSFDRLTNWVKESDSPVYSSNRTGAEQVLDYKFPTLHGFPSDLKKVATLAEVKSTKGSWYTDGTKVYVHRKDDSIPVYGELFVGVSSIIIQPVFTNENCTFMMRDIHIVNASLSAPLYFTAKGSSKGHVILQNIRLNRSDGEFSNGIATEGVKSIWCFNCIVKDTSRDGYNYHNTVDGDTFAFEYDCIAYDCGIRRNDGNNNATTGHEGVRVLRINTKGWNTHGPICADVNGCYSILYDCTMYNSLRSQAGTKTAYWFDNATSNVNPNPNGKAILINCEGGGNDTYGINADSTFKNKRISVDNFRAKNIPSDMQFTIIS